MFDPSRHHEKIAGTKRHDTVAQMHVQTAVNEQKRLILIVGAHILRVSTDLTVDSSTLKQSGGKRNPREC